jgi:(S)-3,5-dihydroxyphenylglycine transaminase
LPSDTAENRAVRLNLADLHEVLTAPVSESMNFLNEVAHRFPDAVSLAAGRPFEGFFDLDDVHRRLDVFAQYLRERLGGDEVKVRRTILQYGRTKGIIHELIARHLQVDEGITVDPEAVVVTVGCQEALYLTLRALRRTDRDALLAVTPSYVGAYGAAELVDMPVLPVRDGDDGIDLDDLVSVVRHARESGVRPRGLYLVPDFSNPTGARLSLEIRRRLLDIAAAEDFLILEDNPYGLLGDEDGPPTIKALDEQARVVYLGSFAKTGLPGARVGYVIADQQVASPGTTSLLADQLGKLKSLLTVNTSPLAQAVIGGKLLENGHSLRAANAREAQVYRANLAHTVAGLERRFPAGAAGPRVTWTVPAGGFFLVLHVPFPAGDDLLEVSAAKHRVLWTPMHHFYAEARPRDAIRLSFSHLLPDEIDLGLDRLAAFIREQSAAH